MIEQSGCSQLRIPGGDWRNCPSDLAGELLERRYGPEEGARVADELRARPLTVKPVRGGGELRWRAAP